MWGGHLAQELSPAEWRLCALALVRSGSANFKWIFSETSIRRHIVSLEVVAGRTVRMDDLLDFLLKNDFLLVCLSISSSMLKQAVGESLEQGWADRPLLWASTHSGRHVWHHYTRHYGVANPTQQANGARVLFILLASGQWSFWTYVLPPT